MARTAYTRLHDSHLGADAIVFPSQVRVSDFDPDQLDGFPEVAAWAGFSLDASEIDGTPGGSPLITVGSGWFDSIERPVVVAGRMLDPTKDDEAVVTEGPAVTDAEIGLGSELVWRHLSPAQAEDLLGSGGDLPADFDWTTAEGPTTNLKVVGVVRLPMDSVASFAATGNVFTSPAWSAEHEGQFAPYFTNAFVRLRNGEADVASLQSDVAAATGRDDVPVKDLGSDVKRVQRSLALEQGALLMFAGALGITAIVIIGQALVRTTAAASEDIVVLRALGMDRSRLLSGLTLPMLITVGVAVVIAGVTSIVASQWFPVALARKLDPSPGVHLDVVREVVGLAPTAAILLATVVGTAFVTLSANRVGDHRARAATAAMRAGAPVPVSVGVSLALDPAGRRGSHPRLAVLAAAIGMIAVVASFAVVRGIDDVASHPERAGASWTVVINGIGDDPDQQAFDRISAADSVTDAAVTTRVASTIDGADAPLYSLSSFKGDLGFTVVRGHAPTANDEILLGPATARTLHAGTGSEVSVGPDSTTMRVVGLALLPQVPHSSFDEGAWVTQSTMERWAGGEDVEQVALLRTAPGITPAAAMATLPSSWAYEEPPVSPDLVNLEGVRALPYFLAGFLAFLAAGAVAHSLFTGSRERDRELAVLRALGLTARQTARAVAWQAATIGTLAIVIGVPLGLALGWRVWHVITDQLYFVYAKPVAQVGLILAGVTCLALCGLLAVPPAWRASRRRISDVLRAE